MKATADAQLAAFVRRRQRAAARLARINRQLAATTSPVLWARRLLLAEVVAGLDALWESRN